MKHTKFIITLIGVLLGANLFGQSLNTDKIELGKFLTRMYNSSPFDGVKVVTDYENSYLLSVVSLEKNKYNNESVANRVANVKAMSQASTYFNGSTISSDLIISTKEKSNGEVESEIIENIKENSVGYVKALEFLTSFDRSDGKRVFMYIKNVDK